MIEETLFFGKTKEQLAWYYRKALSDGRYIQTFEGSYTPKDVQKYKRHYPLGEVKLGKESAVVVIMPEIHSLDTLEKIYEFVKFYVRNETPPDLQGHIAVDKTGVDSLQIAFLSKGVDIGLRVHDSKFATHWDISIKNEMECSLKTAFSNTGLQSITVNEETIYYVMQLIGQQLSNNITVLEKLVEN